MEVEYKLVEHQKKFFLSNKPTVVLNCGRSSGKSYIASLIAALRLKEGKRIFVWAQDFAALSENLFVEIMKRLDEMGIKYKHNANSHKITCGKTGVIYGLSYENVEKCRGFTEIEIAICDEIAMAPADFLSIMTFCMRGKNIKPKIYAMTTPRMNSWWNQYIKKADPNKIEIIHATMKTLLEKEIITQETVDLIKSTCIDDKMYRQEMLGEMVDDSDAGTIFSMNLLTTASQKCFNDVDGYCIGIDCSGLGKDSNVIIVRNQSKILEIIERTTISENEMAHLVKSIVDTRGADKLSHICIDEAFGLGLNERLRELDLYPTLVPFAGAPTNKAFANNRAEMYMNLKKGIETNGLGGINEELFRELQATKYILNNSNKIQLIPKEEIKLNIGRSPDLADALALTYYKPIIPEETWTARVQRQRRFCQ